MCFGGSQPKAPDVVQPMTPPAPATPPPQPEKIYRAPQQLKIEKQEGIVRRKSSKELSGQVNQGTSQLRVPVNLGAGKSGGLNI